MIKLGKLHSCKNNSSVIIAWAFVLFWLAFIFFLSSQPAKDSNALNSRLREYAHASVFFVLALLVSNAFGRSGAKGFRAFLYSFLFCAVYACSDEFHQLFVPGRAMQLIDFTLDCTGALLGLGLCSFIVFISRKIRQSALHKHAWIIIYLMQLKNTHKISMALLLLPKIAGKRASSCARPAA